MKGISLPVATAWSFALLSASGLAQQTPDKTYAIWGHPEAGRRVYAEKGCGKCHAINGVGPTIGPDLGRAPEKQQTITQVAGAMWNHAPQMRRAALERGVRWEPFKNYEMRDLIAFMYFLRIQDQPGNIARGRMLFDEKHCSTCHALGGLGGSIAPDLTRRQQFGSPILWAEIMWRHAVEMEGKMRDRGLEWPRVEGRDMIDLITFVQHEAVGKAPARRTTP